MCQLLSNGRIVSIDASVANNFVDKVASWYRTRVRVDTHLVIGQVSQHHQQFPAQSCLFYLFFGCKEFAFSQLRKRSWIFRTESDVASEAAQMPLRDAVIRGPSTVRDIEQMDGGENL